MRINMGFSSLMMFLIIVILMQLGEVKGFKTFVVGGRINWTVPQGNHTTFYDEWAASKRFHVGDSLHFIYQNDSVLQVDKYGYYHCDITKSTATFTDGDTHLKLEHPDLTYFISGYVDHCINGQRLAVDVMSPHSPLVGVPPESPGPSKAHNSGFRLAPLAQVSALIGLLVTSILFA
ncbi:early nodulin-like protein 7 [Amaranthus tricolor]|uniref:early nodulin-like protein 7 n=1 Tax=Amaranthus tricolor TaxID=29722 RepID=UPI00258B0378|nr:early nodulin-like protein 7 [Amaranthus tricolor]